MKHLVKILLMFALANMVNRAMAQSHSILWYNTPAKSGMTEALPVGNGRIGALVYGGKQERIVLNDSSLWTGGENPSGDYYSMGSYQMLGELFLTPESASGAATTPRTVSLGGQKAFFANQEVSYATDGDPVTKWCVEHGGKPVIWQIEMPAGSSAVTWYSFTAADDVPARDPGTWEFAGSNNGKTWTTLDAHTKQPPIARRGGTERYTFANATAYHFYRLTFQPNPEVPHFQVAEIGMQGLKSLPVGTVSSVPPDFRRELDLATATTTTRYSKDGVHFRREVFASRPADVIVVRWSTDKPGTLSGTIELRGAHDETTDVNGTHLAFVGKFANGIQYTAQARIQTHGGTVSVANGKVRLNGCTEAVILIGAGTNYVFDHAKSYHDGDPSARVSVQLDTASKQSYESLKAAHLAQFQKVRDRVHIDLGTTSAERANLPTDQRRILQAEHGDDPDFEELQFQYGRYLMISCSRPGGVPANLQGLWNDSNNPPWFSDYHVNINVQMNYWLAEVANLSGYQTPLFDLIASQIPAWRKATAASSDWKTPTGAFTTRGFAIRTSHNITGGMGWNWDDSANAWYCQHLWEHYAFTGDKEYLREVAYPILKETVEFWEDHLKTLPDGRLVVPHGWSPEHGPREDGVSYNQEIVTDLFTNYLAATEALGIDKPYAAKVATLRDKLVEPKIGKWGQLQEWMVDRDDPNDQHRHTSHLFAVFPGRQISIAKTPTLAKAAKISLDARTNAPGGDVNEWACVWRAALYARLHDGEQAHSLVQRFARLSSPNLFGFLPGIVQLDGSFGITASIAEMLLQSHEDEINLLPALPKAWANGSFQGLRARGGITVDAAWKNGQLVTATLKSDRDTTAKVRNGNKLVTVKLKAGLSIHTKPNLTLTSNH